MPGFPESLDRSSLQAVQEERLRALLAEIVPANRFYADKFARLRSTGRGLQGLADLPCTTKAELLADQQAHPPYGRILTYPLTRYSRLHQTSGTSGIPLCWLDTPESWQWMLDCWKTIYRIVGLRPGDRLFFPFSFGPFLGFWTAFEAASQLGYFCLPGGGMSSAARLRFLLEHQATVVLCTPTYALHLAEVAQKERIGLTDGAVRALIVAGEPGGSIPAIRQHLEAAWGARVFDHSGLTEVGPATIECQSNPGGLHILEADYLAEVHDPASGRPAPAGELGELVLTNLGRPGSPLIRYRTGDLVRVDPRPCRCGSAFLRLEGGILGRVDDMIHVRGNNLYPAALEAIVRRHPEVVEYQVEVDHNAPMADVRVEIETRYGVAGSPIAQRISESIRDELFFRAEVQAVAPGTLPRYEMKAKRIHHKGRSEKGVWFPQAEASDTRFG
jgi:phenylacetate-CoA ligase